MRNSMTGISVVLLLFLTSALGVPAVTGEELLSLNWQHVDLGTSLGYRGMFCSDVDNDGVEEIVAVCGSKIFAVLESHGAGYQTRDAIQVGGSDQILAAVEIDRPFLRTEVFYLFIDDGTVQIRRKIDLALMDTLVLPGGAVETVVVANITGDEVPELVVANSYSIRVLDGISLQEIVTTSQFADDSIDVGDVDGDGDAEVVLASGTILDGPTLLEEWSYLGGFGVQVAVGDIDGDGIEEIMGMDSWDYVTAIDGKIHTPLWQITVGGDLSCLLLADVEGDGGIEILVGNGQWGDIQCWDPVTQTRKWAIDNPEHGTTRLATGDPDGDGVVEVIWGAGHTSSGQDNLFVASTELHQIEWVSVDLDGPFNVAAGVMEDGDDPSLVISSYGSNSGYDEGVFMVFDALDHVLQWEQDLAGWNNNIHSLGIVEADNEAGHLLLVGSSQSISAWNPIYQGIDWENDIGTIVSLIVPADLSDDGVPEVVVACSSGHVRVYAADGGAQIWSSIDTGGTVRALEVFNIDEDLALEIVFVSSAGYMYAYDGATFALENQASGFSDANSLAAGDWDLDGIPELVVGGDYGVVRLLDGPTLIEETSWNSGLDGIDGLALVNLDQMMGLELIVAGNSLTVVAPSDFSVLWETDAIGNAAGKRRAIAAGDYDLDGLMDVVIGSDWGGFHFEAQVPYPDTTPPTVVRYSPPAGETFVGLDVPAQAEISEALDPLSLAGGVTVNADGAPVGSFEVAFDPDSRLLTVAPQKLWPANVELSVDLRGTLADTAGNGLDGNRNGISEGSPSDDFIWSFFTGTAVDTVGPQITAAGADPDTVWLGVGLVLTATASDASEVAVSTVAGVECYINELGDPGTGIPLEAVDGAFDQVVEAVEISLPTDDWLSGSNAILIRAVDSVGNWGEPATVEVTVLSSDDADWPQFGYDARHQGVNPQASLAEAMTMIWQSPLLAENALSPPCVAAGKVFVTNTNIYFDGAMLTCLDADTGQIVWEQSLGVPFSVNPPSFGYGMVYVQTCNHSGDSWVWAFDALDGTLLWQSPFSSQWSRHLAPTIADGKVFVNGGYYGGMYGYDAFTGDELWWVSLGQYDEWTPAVYDNVAYTSIAGTVTAVNATTGFVLWNILGLEFDWMGYALDTAPVVVSDANVLISTSYRDMHGIDLETREVLWHHNDYFGMTPSVHEGKVYAPTNEGLRIYDLMAGTELGFIAVDCDFPPAMTTEHMVLASSSWIRIYDLETLDQVWSENLGGQVVVTDTRIFVSSSDGQGVVRCFDWDAVPVFFIDCTLTTEGEVVTLDWRINGAGDFRVTAERGNMTWDIPYEYVDDGHFVAIDRPANGDPVTYSVHIREGGDWQLLASRTWNADVPDRLVLTPARPNPFNAKTSIAFGLTRAGEVSLTIYDLRGQRVATLTNGPLPAGFYEFHWDGRADSGGIAGSGLYFARLVTVEGIRTTKLTLAK